MALPIALFGAEDCEDTARTVGVLRALGVPFQAIDIDRDAAAEQFVLAVNAGMRSTPTLVASDGKLQYIATEPGERELEIFLRLAGYALR